MKHLWTVFFAIVLFHGSAHAQQPGGQEVANTPTEITSEDSGENQAQEPDASGAGVAAPANTTDEVELAAGSEGQAPTPDTESPDTPVNPDVDPNRGTPVAAPPSDSEAADDPEAEPTLAPEHMPEMSIELDATDVMTGDLAPVVFEVRAQTGDEVTIPQEQNLEPFELLDTDVQTQQEGGQEVQRFRLDLLALEPGEHTLTLQVRVLTEDGELAIIEAPPLRIRVGSHIANEPNAEPRPPTQPVTVMEEDPTLYWVMGILGVILVTALLTWLFLRWWKKREKAAAPPPPPRPAHEIALEKIGELRRRRDAMLEAGEGDLFVDGVSDAVREYVGKKFGFDGLESTTDETLSALRSQMPPKELRRVQELLRDCDLVKFAKASFTKEQSELLLKGSLGIVRRFQNRGDASATANATGPTGHAPASNATSAKTLVSASDTNDTNEGSDS